MADGFDPYHKWLGIRPEEQPPNHYRLLGLAEFESDADAIDAAAEQRMIFLQNVAHGPHAEQSQQLLNRVSAARLFLLDPQKRAAYDSELRAAAAARIGDSNRPAVPPPLPDRPEAHAFVSLDPPGVPNRSDVIGGVRSARSRSSAMVWVGGGAAAAAIIAIVTITAILATRDEGPDDAKVIIDWPKSERAGAQLLIDDQPRRLGDDRLVVVKVTPGIHRIEMRRTGFLRIIKPDVKLDKGDVRRYKLVWTKSDE
ncbi:MAG: hypothetical protein ACE5KM_03650 [Planctomycetaceae bacterium]